MPYMVQFDASAQSNAELGFPLISNQTSKIYKSPSQILSVAQDFRGFMGFISTSSITEIDDINGRQNHWYAT